MKCGMRQAALAVGVLTGAGLPPTPAQELARTDTVFTAVSRMVEIHLTVSSGKRRFIRGLSKNDFQVFDNGEPQEITAFEADDSGISCALLLDTTGSMKLALPTLKRSVLDFIGSLRTDDAVAVYAFSTQLEQLQDFTVNKADVKRAVLSTRAAGATALFDSVFRVMQDFERVSGKKALLVFTDGDDNASVLNARAAIRHAKDIGVPVFAAALGQALEIKVLIRQIHELSQATGGLAFEMKKSSQAGRIFFEISESLRHGYLLAYRPPRPVARAWRTVEVAAPKVRRARVRARGGYFSEP